VARTGQPATRHVAAVQRAIAILDALAVANSELGTNEIARRTGINVSSISRILATLASGGLVEHLPSTGRYRLGVGVMRLATAVHQRMDIRTLARPHLEEVATRTKETVTLSVPGEHEAITLDFVQSPLSVRSVAEVGRMSAAHATAVGKVFLAHGGTLPGGQLKRFTEQTITDRETLAVEVGRIAERGWAQAVGEREGHRCKRPLAIVPERADVVLGEPTNERGGPLAGPPPVGLAAAAPELARRPWPDAQYRTPRRLSWRRAGA